MPAPWTFTCPHCAGPAFHAIDIPSTAEAARALATSGGLDDVAGRRIEPDDSAECGTCRVSLELPLTFAAMTVQANWTRREEGAAAHHAADHAHAMSLMLERPRCPGAAGGCLAICDLHTACAERAPAPSRMLPAMGSLGEPA